MDDCDLVPISALPEIYRPIFTHLHMFNRIQSQLYPSIFNDDDSLVVTAPTASGKTVLLELAIVNVLMTLGNDLQALSNIQIIYVAPLKALCEERFEDWTKRFRCVQNFTVGMVTGDSDNIQISSLNFNLIITTPEKWDSLTRQWGNHVEFMNRIALFLVDEIHLITDKHRGPTLETVVTRMKYVQNPETEKTMRFLAISATVPNAKEVAEWLSTSVRRCKAISYGGELRPVPLTVIVQGYYLGRGLTEYVFDLRLNAKLYEVIIAHSSGRPTLIFCSTRSSVELAAKALVEKIKLVLTEQQKRALATAAEQVAGSVLSGYLVNGIGIHHGGVYNVDRRIVENLFRESNLPVLITTSTLSMGINLPAHLVIIKNTKQYIDKAYVEYSPLTVIQMLGRAGRPQFDTEAKAVIMTSLADKKKYENFQMTIEPLQSHLSSQLAECILSEINLGTVNSFETAIKWLQSTFFYIRVITHPFQFLPPKCYDLEQWLANVLRQELNRLLVDNLIEMSNDSISTNQVGELMAKYGISLDTIKRFTKLSSNACLKDVLFEICGSREFKEIYLRNHEKAILNALKRSKPSLRFPISTNINKTELKVNCLIQAYLGCIPVTFPSLAIDTEKIIRLAENLCSCLYEYFTLNPQNNFRALVSSFTFLKCLRAEVWENSLYVGRQLPGIDMRTAKRLVQAGLITFDDIIKTSPQKMNELCNTNDGDTIISVVKGLPVYKVFISDTFINTSRETFKVILEIKNRKALIKNLSLHPESSMVVIVGEDLSNDVLFHSKVTHDYMIDNKWWTVNLPKPETTSDRIILKCHVISEHWAGIDCRVTTPVFLKQKEPLPIPTPFDATPELLEFLNQRFNVDTIFKHQIVSHVYDLDDEESDELDNIENVDNLFTSLGGQYQDISEPDTLRDENYNDIDMMEPIDYDLIDQLPVFDINPDFPSEYDSQPEDLHSEDTEPIHPANADTVIPENTQEDLENLLYSVPFGTDIPTDFLRFAEAQGTSMNIPQPSVNFDNDIPSIQHDNPDDENIDNDPHELIAIYIDDESAPPIITKISMPQRKLKPAVQLQQIPEPFDCRELIRNETLNDNQKHMRSQSLLQKSITSTRSSSTPSQDIRHISSTGMKIRRVGETQEPSANVAGTSAAFQEFHNKRQSPETIRNKFALRRPSKEPIKIANDYQIPSTSNYRQTFAAKCSSSHTSSGFPKHKAMNLERSSPSHGKLGSFALAKKRTLSHTVENRNDISVNQWEPENKINVEDTIEFAVDAEFAETLNKINDSFTGTTTLNVSNDNSDFICSSESHDESLVIAGPSHESGLVRTPPEFNSVYETHVEEVVVKSVRFQDCLVIYDSDSD